MKIFFIFLLALMVTYANASGPLILEGPTGNTPVRYQNPNIVLNFDLDMLAVTANNTNAESDQLVLDAFSLWNDVTINLGLSTINLTQGGDINVDGTGVDGTNYATFIPAGIGASIPPDDGQNPVIYDADGAIIDIFFGIGQSNDIGGFAASSFFIGGSAFIEGFAVINGKNLGIGQTQTTIIVAHEIGHFIGLDHAVADIDVNSPETCPAPGSKYPLMYPIACRTTIDLHQDDITSVSTLYPSVDINQQLGQITGTFLQNDNTAILGGNIWAQNTTTMEVYSVISDYLAGGTGFFSMYLPPGNYTLHANSIDSSFNDGSGVGPYADDPVTSASFIAPHPITPVSFEGSTPGSDVILIITAGEATNVTFKLDGTGSVTDGNDIFTPPTPTNTKKPKGGGGGGSTTPVSLMLLVAMMHLRIFRHRQKY